MASWKRPYYIGTPGYKESSGGIRFMHQLCHHLNMAGQLAYVWNQPINPRLNAPCVNTQILATHQAEARDPIMVSPMIGGEVPSGARTIARIMLNHITGMALPTVQPDELFFSPVRSFIPADWNYHHLWVPFYDTKIYRPPAPGTRRSGSYLLSNWYLKQGKLIPPQLQHLPILGKPKNSDDWDQTLSHAELAAIYQRIECLYLLEPTSAAIEAMLCGCPVVFIPNPNALLHPDWCYCGPYGNAWGDSEEQLEHARSTIERVPEFVETLRERFPDDLATFIELTQNH
jgi:hypothetical protein